MNRIEVEGLVGTVTLPKNFRIEVHEAVTPTPVIMITAHWPDIYQEGGWAQTYGTIYVDEHLPVNFIVHQIDREVHRLWDHELHEYFKIAGAYVHDPHPDGVDGPLG